MYEQIQEAVAYIRSQTDFQPRSGVILGTGLGNFTDDLQVLAEIPYTEIPHFARSTVESHKGKLVFGLLGKHPLVVMAGRFHYYEGWTMQQITFPVRVMRYLGIERLIITNASGGVNPHLQGGDIVVVRDHINLLPEHPLRGPNDERLGPRFPDMLHTYDKNMRRIALDAAKAMGIRAFEGVYSVLQGPNLETPAEYEMLHRLGSDCTGMSSVPEALVAKHMELPVAMLSMVANVSYPPSAIKETSLEDVIAVAREAEPKLRRLVAAILEKV
ncbi:MAG: purine-nucleoside phosphorylase [Chitinophagales bacterium]|jgi:purine-nucleoside phosphorylase|nr:purine-nucleoside phosphorylase [Chitinophagales bacterium]